MGQFMVPSLSPLCMHPSCYIRLSAVTLHKTNNSPLCLCRQICVHQPMLYPLAFEALTIRIKLGRIGGKTLLRWNMALYISNPDWSLILWGFSYFPPKSPPYFPPKSPPLILPIASISVSGAYRVRAGRKSSHFAGVMAQQRSVLLPLFTKKYTSLPASLEQSGEKKHPIQQKTHGGTNIMTEIKWRGFVRLIYISRSVYYFV